MTTTVNNNPFVGLRPFESKEDYLFFGREEQVLQLLQLLHQHHFVAVIGSSGSGKSSLIKAGLIPALQAGYLVNESDHWSILSMKPGQDPLYNLAFAITQHKDTPAIEVDNFVSRINEEATDAVLDFLKPLWQKNINFFLLVDQFEELFRFSLDQKEVEKRDEATNFVNILLALSQQKELPIYIVLTMRSDFIGDCTRFFGLPEALNQSQYLVPRLSRTQLKTSIEGPVKLYNGKINPALTARLLNDAQIIKDELPLLQHVLMRIWDYENNVNQNGELDLEDYTKIGGIEKALSNHADEALEGMSEAELVLAKKIFQALTAIDENGRKIRRPVLLNELEELTGADRSQLLSIINRFVEGNRSFLIINRSGEEKNWLIDICHESLIRQWGTLSKWVDEEAESVNIYKRLVESANLYAGRKKDLMTGSELELTTQWYTSFNPKAVWAIRYEPGYERSITYLEDSVSASVIEEKKKKSRKKNMLALLIGFIVVMMTILVLTFTTFKLQKLKDDAYRQKEIANKERGKALNSAKLADKLRLEADSSASKAIYARILADSSLQEASREKLAALVNLKQAQIARNQLDSQKQQVALSSEAFRLITIALQQVKENPTIALRIAEAAVKKKPDSVILNAIQRIYHENSFYKILMSDSVRKETSPYPFPFTISQDGKNVFYDSKNNGVVLRNLQNGSMVKFHPSSEILCAAISPDSKNVIISYYSSTTNLWSVSNNLKKEISNQHAYQAKSFAFSQNGDSILIGGRDGVASLCTIEGSVIKEFYHGNQVLAVALSSDDKQILTGSVTDSVRLWSINGDLIAKSIVYGQVGALAFSPDGKSFAVAANTLAEIWQLDNNKQILELIGHTGNISCIAFSRDGQKVVTGSYDGTARLWSIDGGFLKEFKGQNGPIHSIVFSPGGKTIITGSLDGKVFQWNIDDSVTLEQLLNSNRLEQLTKEQKNQFGIQ